MNNRELRATVEIVESPHRVSRLLGLLPDNRPYLVSWVTVKMTLYQGVNSNGDIFDLEVPTTEQCLELALLTVEPGGSVKVWGALGEPIPDDWMVSLGYQPPPNILLSPDGFKRARGIERAGPKVADPARIFEQLVDVFDTFLDLSSSIDDQRGTAELMALYVMATWVSDGFAAFPYLWPSGDKGAGKTKTLGLVGRLSYLGQIILAGGSYAALRDLAEYGATLCFDDAENIADPRKSDRHKRALLLAGNRKGAFVPVKEPEGRNGWRIRNVSAYAPKAFSAISLPDATLGRRTIVVPLVRSADPDKANHDIEEDHYWPHDRRTLVDDLWIFGLHYLPAARVAYDRMRSTTLVGPGFEPWRPIFATAQIVEEAGIDGLTDRMRSLAVAYQAERADFEVPDMARIAVLAVAEIADVRTLADTSDGSMGTDDGLQDIVTFTATDVAERMNRIARDEGLVEVETSYVTPTKVGRVLEQLRIKGDRDPHGRKRTRLRSIRKGDVAKLCRAYGLLDDEEHSDPPRQEASDVSGSVRQVR